jgi:muramoyltetrapeptide carboxypeptidase
MSLRWRPLKKGDLVDVVCPGSRTSDDTIQNGVLALEAWGLKARVQGLFGHDVICANSDANRFESLKIALYAKDSQAVWCARGGYGSIRLIPFLLKLKKPAPVKLFMGLSDISSLHLFLNQNWHWPTLHAPLLDRLALQKIKPKYERELKQVVFGETKSLQFSRLRALNQAARRPAKIKAEIAGGNCVVLASHLGSKLALQSKGKILFLEEIGERGYRLDRVLEQMRQAAIFDHCAAVLFGDLVGGEEPDGKSKVKPVIERFAQQLSIPVLKGIQSGHAEIQRPVPFAAPSILQLGDQPELSCETGVL